MPTQTQDSKQVSVAVREALENSALSEAVLEFGETRILFSKGRRLEEQMPALEEPPQYPDVPTNLQDDEDSWLK